MFFRILNKKTGMRNGIYRKKQLQPRLQLLSLLCGTILRLLNHDFELCSKSFTFGIIQTSLILRSLNHDFNATDDVDATLGGHAVEATTVEGVPCI